MRPPSPLRLRLPDWSLLLTLALCACGGAGERPAEGAPRPNIVVLLADDLRHDALGYAGHPWVRTPAIDALARGGVRFRNAFVTTSLCSPSRVSILTGTHASRHGVHENQAPLPDDLPTFATLLAEAGWDTGYFGKWHLGPRAGAARGERPGFARSVSYDGQGRYVGARFSDEHGALVDDGSSRAWVDDVATDHALAFLRAPRDRPFLAFVGFKGPHRPRRPPQRHRDAYAGLPLASPPNARAFPPFPLWHEFRALAERAGVPPARFRPPEQWPRPQPRVSQLETEPRLGDEDYRRDAFRVVTGIDDDVGRILEALRELGVERDTIVVFLSDNGIGEGEHGLVAKRSAY